MSHQADACDGDDWILHNLSDLYLDQGRPEDGLAHLDALAAARGGEEDWDLFRIRLPLMAACDGVDEAIEQARAHPERPWPSFTRTGLVRHSPRPASLGAKIRRSDDVPGAQAMPCP
ncbi:hypothetical protein AB0L35_10740 [Streptomyces sp. NPDC052309]|uniref:hypothetical protein n=1 Tax=Streptomyces sp. NPDC052309 TaxID=3155421 RepID=UPI003430CD51